MGATLDQTPVRTADRTSERLFAPGLGRRSDRPAGRHRGRAWRPVDQVARVAALIGVLVGVVLAGCATEETWEPAAGAPSAASSPLPTQPTQPAEPAQPTQPTQPSEPATTSVAGSASAATAPRVAEPPRSSPRAADRRARRTVPPPLDPNVPPDVDADLVIPAAARFGDGFLVWESVRSGNWRIWTRRLDGSGLRQLSPDEGDRQHCCPHIAPDGSAVAYLSVPPVARHQYPPGGLVGPLRVMAADGTEDRAVVPLARDYGDHRVAVWRSPRELIHLDGRGMPMLLDLASGTATAILAREEARPDHGYLVDATLSWATAAVPSFAPVDRATGRLGEVDRLRGCEPYFSHDGTFAFFVERGGGPILSFDLATRRIATILERADPRLPDGFDYLYFPMVSRAGNLLAFGASRGLHDQFRADYEIFLARFDAATRELVEPPTRFTAHPATDRFPDVWAGPRPAASAAPR